LTLVDDLARQPTGVESSSMSELDRAPRKVQHPFFRAWSGMMIPAPLVAIAHAIFG
jgi:hypothetical protein